MLSLCYFARLREQLGCASEQLAWSGTLTLGELRQQLQQRGEPWHSALADVSLRMAVNQQLETDGQRRLADGDEVAFFPPVTGG